MCAHLIPINCFQLQLWQSRTSVATCCYKAYISHWIIKNRFAEQIAPSRFVYFKYEINFQSMEFKQEMYLPYLIKPTSRCFSRMRDKKNLRRYEQKVINKGNEEGNKTTDGIKNQGKEVSFKQIWQAKGHGSREGFSKTLNQVLRQISRQINSIYAEEEYLFWSCLNWMVTTIFWPDATEIIKLFNLPGNISLVLYPQWYNFQFYKLLWKQETLGWGIGNN